MTDHPILFASYSGVLGGAERVLLDCVDAAGAAAARRLPAGAAGGRAARGRRSSTCPTASARGLGARPRRRAGRPDARARAACGPPFARRLGRPRGARRRAVPARAVARRPPRPASDAARAAWRAAGQRQRADGDRDRVPGDRRRARRRPATVLHPGVDLDAFTPTPLPDGPPARARARRARAAGSARTSRSRSPRRMPGPALHVRRRAAARRPTMPDARRRPESVHVRRPRRRRARRRSPAHHVLLHCADAEPYGLVLVEALAAGRPVVAPAAGGPLEIVRTAPAASTRPATPTPRRAGAPRGAERHRRAAPTPRAPRPRSTCATACARLERAIEASRR